MNVTLKIEKLTKDLILEVEQILADNYEETKHFDEPLDIDWNMYLLIPTFTCFILRNTDNRIVGILFFVVTSYPHLKELLMAQQVTFYIEPEYRMNAFKMLQISEQHMSDNNVNIIVQSARFDSRFGKLLEHKGYEPQDITFTKRLN